MLPQTQKRKARSSTKVNLLFSLTFHGNIALALAPSSVVARFDVVGTVAIAAL